LGPCRACARADEKEPKQKANNKRDHNADVNEAMLGLIRADKFCWGNPRAFFFESKMRLCSQTPDSPPH
jgi:hypothetical protein